jgi:hypothetical protein
VRGSYACPADHPVPLAVLALEEEALGFTAFTAIRRLLDGDPPIAVAEGQARRGALVLNPISLHLEEIPGLTVRLWHVLAGKD